MFLKTFFTGLLNRETVEPTAVNTVHALAERAGIGVTGEIRNGGFGSAFARVAGHLRVLPLSF